MFTFAHFKYKIFKGFIVLFFLIMFFFPYASYQGASTGLLLWFLNVLPTLLPFIIISNLMIKLNIASRISSLLHPLLGRILRLSSNGCYPVLVGFLSGMPMGAKSTADLVTEKIIDQQEGDFLLSLCNNTSPVFIMNYIAVNQLKLPQIRLPLFVIIYSSSILSALIYRFFKTKAIERRTESTYHISKKVSITENISPASPRFTFDIMDGSIMNGFEVVTIIGGYIILFSILAQIINDIGPDAGFIKASLMGFLEVTTGINQICRIPMDLSIKIVLVTVLTSFGGLSGLAQTKSVLGSSGLSIKSYLIVKLLSAFIALGLSLCYVSVFRL